MRKTYITEKSPFEVALSFGHASLSRVTEKEYGKIKREWFVLFLDDAKELLSVLPEIVKDLEDFHSKKAHSKAPKRLGLDGR